MLLGLLWQHFIWASISAIAIKKINKYHQQKPNTESGANVKFDLRFKWTYLPQAGIKQSTDCKLLLLWEKVETSQILMRIL